MCVCEWDSVGERESERAMEVDVLVGDVCGGGEC